MAEEIWHQALDGVLEERWAAQDLDHLYDPTTLPARVEGALLPAINPKATTTYNGEKYAIEDLPSPALRAMMGYGHHPVDLPRRERLTRPDNVPWTYTPETCLIASNVKGVWLDAEHLACPGCGVDYT